MTDRESKTIILSKPGDRIENPVTLILELAQSVVNSW
jgi:hypothetical protein